MSFIVGNTGSKTGFEQVFASAERFIMKFHHKSLSHQLITLYCIISITPEKIKKPYWNFMVFWCFQGVEICKIEDKWFMYPFCFNKMKLQLYTNSSNTLNITNCKKAK